MSEKTLKTRIRHAVKKESEWASLNPVLLEGEIAYSSDLNGKYKIGDGTSTWSQLSYAIPVANATTSAAGLMSASDKSKLDGITNSADAVSFSQSLTSGTKVGTITINGTGTDLYCQTNTDTHYTSHLYVGASGGNANATSATSNPYLLCVDNTTNRNSIQLKAGSNMSISATNGVVTFTAKDTTYSTATTSANGLMSSSDKSKLDGIEEGANNYTHPTTAGNKHIPSGGSSGKILRWASDGTAVWGDESNSNNTGVTTVTPTETSWYTGKKIVCYGTSITEQGQTVSNWISNLVNKLICKIDNQGHGGCRVVNYQEGDLATMTMLQNLPTNGDVNIFEGGINDWRNPSIKVNSSGSGFMSFKDALRRIADYYLTNMPQAINLWITPHYCLTVVDGTATDTVGGESLEDYANAMIEVAEEYGIPCVDLYHNCGWRSKNISTFVNNESGAYIHPNAKGGVRMYSLILNKLKELEPTIDYNVEGSSSSGGSSGDSSDNKLSSEVVLTPLKIGITEHGVFTNYTNSTSGEIIKISDTNYKLNLTAGSGKYLAIETGNTTNNLRLATKKISGSLNATLYHATSLTSTSGQINTLADAYGYIQTPLASNNGLGYILVSITHDLNAECYIYIGNSYTNTSTTDEEKEKISNTFFT